MYVTGLFRPCVVSVGRRVMSSAAAGAQHTPALKLYGIPARYANATYMAASKANSLNEVERDLLALKAVLDKNANLRSFFSNPTISRQEKVGLMEKTFGDKKKTSEITKNLFVTMAANARLEDTSKVVESFLELMRAKRGEVNATVTTAEPLSPQQAKAVMESIKSSAGASNVILEMNVNPSLIGGLTVKIGDKFMDLSIASRISSAKDVMMGST